MNTETTKKKAPPKARKKKTATKKKATKKTAAKKAAPRKKAAAATKKSVKVTNGKSLVVVESPAKAKTIRKYLGTKYEVMASVGHVKDLPKSKLSVDVDNDFLPKYETIRGKATVLKKIKSAAKNAPVVLLAPDPDREGEAIAWHIALELGDKMQEKVKRITFNEITKRAVTAAVAAPEPLDRKRYESQQARRILDRIVGYQISPILWDKVRRGLSAGRVQSVAVRLITEREAEIRAFNSEEYWTVDCELEGEQPPPFIAKVAKENGKKYAPTTEAEAHAARDALDAADFKITAVERKERRRRPVPPLITSRLQQQASKKLGFTAKRTMMIAQQLYEGVEFGLEGNVALITYMRTDSTRVSNDALEEVRGHISSQFGSDYLPEKPNFYKSKKGAQDAHEAVRPTSMDNRPARVKQFLNRDQFRLYEVIWRAFVSSQMTPAVFDQTGVDIEAGRFGLRASGSVLKFPGFLAAFGVEVGGGAATAADNGKGKDTDRELPVLRERQTLKCNKIIAEQHFTQPPPRFSESSLVKELEDKGIGRPSTYAAILSTIVTRGYVKKDEGRFYPTELGDLITGLLIESFPRVMDVAFTAKMEDELDDVEEGKVDWVELLKGFYFGGFKDALESAKTNMRDVKREETPTEHKCEQCDSTMNIKWGRNGSFLACSGYPKCRGTRDYERLIDGTLKILPEQKTDKLCPTCQGGMLVKRGRFGKFLACAAYPECKGTRPVPMGVDCPDCSTGYIAERRSQRGRVFYGCSDYPECTFASWDRPVSGTCPECQSKYLVRRFSKTKEVRIICPVKGCSYERDPTLNDADAKAVSAAME